MARRGGRPRHKAPREPNGRILRSIIDQGSLYLQAQRLTSLEKPAASKAARALHPVWRELELSSSRRRSTQSDERSQALLATLAPMRNRTNLSFPMGIAFERGLLAWDDLGANGAHHDGLDSLNAGIRYAQIHSVVWRGLRKDVASTPTLSSDDIKELLLSLNSGMPAPPSSFFSKLVARNPVSPESEADDPEEYHKLRWRAGNRLGAARAVLLAQSAEFLMGPVLRVEKVITLDEMPDFLKPGRERTAADQREAAALRGVLKALAEHFGYGARRGKS